MSARVDAPALGRLVAVMAPDPLPGPPTRIVAAPGLPPDLQAGFAGLLDGFDRSVLTAAAPQRRVRENVFINRAGHIWDAHGNLVRPHAIPLPEESRRAMAAAPVAEDVAFGSGGESNRNFFHWTVETLPSLGWCLDAERAPMPISISMDAPRFVIEGLALAARHAFTVMPVGDALLVRRLHVVQFPVRALGFRNLYAALCDRMVTRAATSSPAGPEKLYISRGDAQRRPMGNEAELEAALARLGYQSVAMGKLPLAHQIAMVRSARSIVAAHGAGLTHLMFAQPGCHVVEIFPAAFGLQPARANMARLSRIFGHAHSVWIETGAKTERGWMVSIQPLIQYIEGG